MQLGFGAAGAWAQAWFDEARATALIRAAWDGGIIDFDTAGFYAGGRAELRLARALAGIAGAEETVRVSTKLGKTLDADGKIARDFTEAGLARQLATSVQTLAPLRIDTVYLHGPSLAEMTSALPLLLQWRAAGAFRQIGICADGAVVTAAAHAPGVDVIMARYNLFDTRHASAIARAAAAGKAVTAIAPLAQGLWRRDIFVPRSIADVWKLARAVIRAPGGLNAAQRAAWLRALPGWSPLDLALAFVRDNPAIGLAITSTTKPEHLIETLRAARRPVPTEVREYLARHSPLTD